MNSTRFRRKLRRFGRLRFDDKVLFLRAIAWLGVARLLIAIVPFNSLSSRLSGDREGVNDSTDPHLCARVGFVVAAAANNVPWRSDCFPQTIAARMLLKRYGYGSTIHFGVDRSSATEIRAHAWLSCGDTIVTGGEEIQRYTELHRIEP